MATQGPLSPTAAADDATVGTIAWSNPGNILASDNNKATASLTSLAASHYLVATGFGFSLPGTATVDGIQVDWEIRGATGAMRDHAVRIVKGGAFGSENKASGLGWPLSDTPVTYGGAADTWTESWTATDINASNFGAATSAEETASSTATAEVDHVTITVTYTAAAWSAAEMPGFTYTQVRRMPVRSVASVDRPLEPTFIPPDLPPDIPIVVNSRPAKPRPAVARAFVVYEPTLIPTTPVDLSWASKEWPRGQAHPRPAPSVRVADPTPVAPDAYAGWQPVIAGPFRPRPPRPRVELIVPLEDTLPMPSRWGVYGNVVRVRPYTPAPSLSVLPDIPTTPAPGFFANRLPQPVLRGLGTIVTVPMVGVVAPGWPLFATARPRFHPPRSSVALVVRAEEPTSFIQAEGWRPAVNARPLWRRDQWWWPQSRVFWPPQTIDSLRKDDRDSVGKSVRGESTTGGSGRNKTSTGVSTQG